MNQVIQLNETLPTEQQFVVNENTVLFGKESAIDSLSLVSIIVDLETIFSADYNQDISLTDDRAMTRSVSPFSSISNLVDYIFELVNQNN